MLQSRELADRLVTLEPKIDRFYSSPFYRCVQTLWPTVERVAGTSSPAAPETALGDSNITNPSSQNQDGREGSRRREKMVDVEVRLDNGLGEWYGTARFDHPSPAPPSVLQTFFPLVSTSYSPSIIPSTKGESIADLHDRVAYALAKIIGDCDTAGVKAIVICTHAATLYAIGRALTGNMPEDIAEEDFRPFTCGLSTFVRRTGPSTSSSSSKKAVPAWKPGDEIPPVSWRNGKGVGGGWDCTLNGDCAHLSGGEERGWRFSGDESFLSADKNADAGSEMGVVVQGRERSGSRL